MKYFVALIVCLSATGCAFFESDEFQTVKDAAVSIAVAYGEQRGDEYLKQAVADGKITQEQADELRDAVKTAVEKK